MRNIAIITARSGSKGLVDKNIKDFNGKPLLSYSITEALRSGVFERVLVSTDSDKYKEIAIEYGADVPFLRSAELSTDSASSWMVVCEVLKMCRELGCCYDTVCLLQPTSPLRTSKDIVDAYDLFNSLNAGAVTGVCELDHSPDWNIKLGPDLEMTERRNQFMNLPRQMLEKYYRINGAIFIRKIVYNDSDIDLVDKPEYAFVMNRENSVDIDTEIDFVLAETLFKLRKDDWT